MLSPKNHFARTQTCNWTCSPHPDHPKQRSSNNTRSQERNEASTNKSRLRRIILDPFLRLHSCRSHMLFTNMLEFLPSCFHSRIELLRSEIVKCLTCELKHRSNLVLAEIV